MDAAQRNAIQQFARERRNYVREVTIRTLSRERGGINERTREAIFAEAEAKAVIAARAVYTNAGYGECLFETADTQTPESIEGLAPKTGTPFFVCTQLTTPGYRYCPKHGQAAKKPVAGQMSLPVSADTATA